MSISASKDDVVLSGHGALANTDSQTVVPEGIELVLLAPPGASISDELGGLLESGQKIKKLKIVSPKTRGESPHKAISYSAGETVPDYVLHPPRGLELKPGVPHMLGVEKATPLSSLWTRINVFTRPGSTIKCYWSACTALAGASNPVVIEG